jgi:apolipoprotein N-acyltransferase
MNSSEGKLYWWFKGPFEYARSGGLRPLHLLGLALLTGLLATLAWHPSPAQVLLFPAFVPLMLAGELVLASKAKRRGFLFWGTTYIAMLSWNIGVTWWIVNSTLEGAIAANVLNALFMTVPWQVYIRLRVRWGVLPGLCGLTLSWLLFEILHLRWDLTWPWLTLGNAFATRPDWVQWYEWLGTLGGSAWVWWVNGILFLGFAHSEARAAARALCWGTAVFLLMITVSYGILPWAAADSASGGSIEMVVVQPNIDPYTQKFEGTPAFIPYQEQIDRMWRLSDSLITPNTQWVLWPETALDASLPEDRLADNELILPMQKKLDTYPGLHLIVGATTYTYYPKEAAPASARQTADGSYYDVFNTALHLESGSKQIGIYHKSKLVPGVEGFPFPAVLGPLTALVIDLGGTAGGLGKQDTRANFSAKASGKFPASSIAPAICYESIYGDFMADFARAGSTTIGIITNDAWWGNTAGHQQHFAMARLRAIEERRWVARAANTGISGLIDASGSVRQTLPYLKQGALRLQVGQTSPTKTTLYMRLGDWGVFLFVLAMCFVFIRYGPGR